MSYHRFKDESDQEFGSFEVFELSAGWFWHACFPGCLPDGDPSGPYTTEAEAIAAAQDF